MAKALIYAADGTEIVEQCQGADWAGACPRAAAGAPVACAGRKVIAIGPGGLAVLTLRVEPDATTCPLAALSFLGDETAGGAGAPRRKAKR
jgi:hypothetical protein